VIKHALRSLLPRGTKTWQKGNQESTIDLVLASEEPATSVVKCITHTTEHGSDHKAIEIKFDIAAPERVVEARLLFKNAPWTDIRTRIAAPLDETQTGKGSEPEMSKDFIPFYRLSFPLLSYCYLCFRHAIQASASSCAST